MLLNTLLDLDLPENLPKFAPTSQVKLEPPLALPTMCYYFSTNTHTHHPLAPRGGGFESRGISFHRRQTTAITATQYILACCSKLELSGNIHFLSAK